MISKKILAIGGALLMAAPLVMQLPAEAQYWGNRWDNRWNHNYNFNIDRTQSQILNRLNSGLSRGSLTQREYNNLLSRYNRINNLEAQLRMGGLSFSERMRLQQQLRNLNDRVYRNYYDRQTAGRYNRFWF
jgi:hypothetical protein